MKLIASPPSRSTIWLTVPCREKIWKIMPATMTIDMKWQVGERLGQTLEPPRAQLVEHEGQHDRQGEDEDQGQPTEDDGVLEHVPELRVLDEQLDVVQAHPLVAEDAAPRPEAVS